VEGVVGGESCCVGGCGGLQCVPNARELRRVRGGGVVGCEFLLVVRGGMGEGSAVLC